MENILTKTIFVPYTDCLFARTEPCCEDDLDDWFGEDETITYTAVFRDGMEMDIKICKVEFIDGECNTPYTEAVLFKDGYEVACSTPSEGLEGEWELEYNDVLYQVIVEVE